MRIMQPYSFEMEERVEKAKSSKRVYYRVTRICERSVLRLGSSIRSIALGESPRHSFSLSLSTRRDVEIDPPLHFLFEL